jgi:hypothetical protein
MSIFVKHVVAAHIFLLLSGGTSINTAQQGFLEGHLKIVSLREVEPSDEMPRQIVTAKRYAQFPLVILSQEEKKEIVRVTADENGNYRVGLPPGNYILDVQDRELKRIRAMPQQFTVVSNQTVRVDMAIDTDHWRSSSMQ